LNYHLLSEFLKTCDNIMIRMIRLC